MSRPRSTVGVIGGSGMDQILEAGTTKQHKISTPFGAPSGPISEGELGGVRVLLLARHGPGHTIPPHRVNYRANIEALRTLGAEAIVATNSVGSLREELRPGEFVLPDQFVDLTKQRATTFFDGGKVYHVSLADPFCPELSRLAVEAGTAHGSPFHVGKTYVCVEGPRFSTRAESKYFRSFADIIGMTLVPEVTLARERALCYVCLAMVTDYDVWADRPVELEEIVRVMGANVSRMRGLLERYLPTLARRPECHCANALDAAGI